MTEPNHYEVLNVSRSATVPEIKAAFRTILLTNHLDKTHHLPPFARLQVDKYIRTANAAWEVLSDPTNKREYDRALPYIDPFAEPSRTSSHNPPFGAPSPEREFPRASSGFGFSYDDGDAAGDTDEVPRHKQAEFRYGQTPTATDVDMKISGWRLYMLISSKYRFMKRVSELSNPDDGTETISFKIGLNRSESFRKTSEHGVPEMFLGIEHIPDNMHVSKVQTLYRQLTTTSSSLTITIAGSCQSHQIHSRPWKFGFDFDLNCPAAWRHVRGTRMIFSIEEPDEALKNGQGLDTPECTLKWDKIVKADVCCALGPLRLEQMTYGDARMWRLASVGYRKGEFLQAD